VPADTVTLSILFFVAAVLYTSVGHAGGSGYLAAMAWMGFAPEVMRPTALVTNVLVACIATWRYAGAKLLDWRTLRPFAAASVPAAFLGGRLPPLPSAYKVAVGVVLLAAAARLTVARGGLRSGVEVRRPPLAAALAWGAVIGLIAGFTGTGGGIFLTPVLLFAGWSELRAASGISAAFILVNSLAGIAANPAALRAIPPNAPWWAAAAVAGALIGTELGTRRVATGALRIVLAVVLALAAAKLVLS